LLDPYKICYQRKEVLKLLLNQSHPSLRKLLRWPIINLSAKLLQPENQLKYHQKKAVSDCKKIFSFFLNFLVENRYQLKPLNRLLKVKDSTDQLKIFVPVITNIFIELMRKRWRKLFHGYKEKDLKVFYFGREKIWEFKSMIHLKRDKTKKEQSMQKPRVENKINLKNQELSQSTVKN